MEAQERTGPSRLRPLIIVVVLAVPCGIAAASEPRIEKAPSPWLPESQPVSDFATGLDASAAGCVVAGVHIGKQGRVARAQVLQGAFTAKVSPAEQVEVQKAIQSDLLRWTFRPVKSKVPPPADRFEMVTVWFLPATSGEPQRTVIGAARQHAGLGRSCEIGSLAQWGKRHAIAVEQARQRGSGEIVVSEPGDRRLLWVPDAMLPPRYPPIAYVNGVGGCVRVAYVVREDGGTDQVKLLSVDPDPPDDGGASLAYRSRRAQAIEALTQASLLAVSQWRFAPGPDNLERRPALMSSPLSFSVGGQMQEGCEGAATVAELLGDAGGS